PPMPLTTCCEMPRLDRSRVRTGSAVPRAGAVQPNPLDIDELLLRRARASRPLTFASASGTGEPTDREVGDGLVDRRTKPAAQSTQEAASPDARFELGLRFVRGAVRSRRRDGRLGGP